MSFHETIKYFYLTNLSKIIEHGSPWSQYKLAKLNRLPSADIKHRLLAHQNFKALINKLHHRTLGIVSLDFLPADFRIYDSYFWILRFLADIGLAAEEVQINHLLKRLLLQQTEEGQFVIHYYKKRQQSISLICMTASLCYCLCGLGWQESATVKAALELILESQRSDGGWHCESLKQNGEKEKLLPSCPAASLFVFRALGQFGKKYENIISTIIPSFFQFLNSPALFSCPYLFFHSINFKKLRYPPHFTGLDILNIFDSLSFFPELLDSNLKINLAIDIWRRWDGIHFLRAEKRISSWAAFDFAHNLCSSDWITAIFLGALKRYFENDIL